MMWVSQLATILSVLQNLLSIHPQCFTWTRTDVWYPMGHISALPTTVTSLIEVLYQIRLHACLIMSHKISCSTVP